MRRFTVTGTPGAGKKAVIRQLELEGFGIVEEAATDVIAAEQARGIAKPWTQPSFIDLIANQLCRRPIRWPHSQPADLSAFGQERPVTEQDLRARLYVYVQILY